MSKLQGLASYGLVIMLVVGEVYQFYDPRFERLSVWIGLDRVSREQTLGISGSWMAILAAYMLYHLKRDGRFWYGVIELLFAMATTWLWATTSNGSISWLGFLASVYLFVAGLENCVEAVKSKKKAKALDIPC